MSVRKFQYRSVGADVAGPVDYSLDKLYNLGYAKFAGKPILPLTGTNSVTSHLDSGETLKASNGVITYTFLDKDHLTGLYNNPTAGFTSAYGLSTYTPDQQVAARTAIQLWDDLIPQTFRETNGQGADIVFANSLDPAQAYAYYPGHKGWKFQSDVFTNDPNVPAEQGGNWTNNWFTYGGYGRTTLVHELGHTLGLSHPGNYNYDPNLDLTYTNYAEYAQDSTQYTIMSYWDATETGARIVNWNALLFSYAQTPLLHDIYVIQEKYGADPTTRATNTVYGFNSTADNPVYDFNKNPYPYLSIYDAGGNDTLDLSGFNVSQFVDLRPGSFSSVGAGLPNAAAAQAELDNITHLSGQNFGTYDAAYTAGVMDSFMTGNAARIAQDLTIYGEGSVTDIRTSEYQNLSIAYGTIIENATGGSARDLLIGNDVDNVLKGLAGDDVLRGMGGNDTLIGGAGKDTLTGGTGKDKFVFANDGSIDTITDFQKGVDKIDLSGIIGATAANTTWDAKNNLLKIDVDHNGTTDVSIIVLGSVPSLTGDILYHA